MINYTNDLKMEKSMDLSKKSLGKFQRMNT